MDALTLGRGVRLKGSEAIILDFGGVLVASEVTHVVSAFERLERERFVYQRGYYLIRSVGLSNAGCRAQVGSKQL